MSGIHFLQGVEEVKIGTATSPRGIESNFVISWAQRTGFQPQPHRDGFGEPKGQSDTLYVLTACVIYMQY
jgi:hypothetical protein